MFCILTLGVGISEWEDFKILERELAWFQAFQQKGWEIHIISTSVRDLRRQRYIQNNYSSIRFSFLGNNPIKQYLGIKRISKQILDRKATTIVRSNQLLGSHLLVWFPQKKHGRLIKILRMGYNPSLNYQKSGHRIKALLAEWYLACVAKRSHLLEVSNKNIVSSNLARTINRPIFEFSNYVDEAVWSAPRQEKSKSDKIRLIFFGRFEKEKNLETLIKAVKETGLSLTLIGSGSNQDSLMRYARTLNADVTFFSRISGFELSKIVSEHDFAVLTSLFEGNPKMILESMSLGLPIICTPIDAIHGIITDQESGFICEGFETRHLTAKLLIAKGISQEQYRNLSKNALRKAQEFGLKNIVEQQNQIYKQISQVIV
jgi:glycosyltransferase involved in cell wall biosynthesis